MTELDQFVPRNEIDKLYFNNPYYIARRAERNRSPPRVSSCGTANGEVSDPYARRWQGARARFIRLTLGRASGSVRRAFFLHLAGPGSLVPFSVLSSLPS
jgi:hypothetical protein